MGFGEDLWCPRAHAAVLRLLDEELQRLQAVEAWMRQSAKSQRLFASQLAASRPQGAEPEHASQLGKAWGVLVSRTESLGQLMLRRSDQLTDGPIRRLGQLIRDKQQLRKSYARGWSQLRQELSKVTHTEVERLKVSYRQASRERAQARRKLEEASTDWGRGRAQRRYVASTQKLLQLHNQLVLGVKAAEEQQLLHYRSLQPRMMGGVQGLLEDGLLQLHEVLLEYVDMSSLVHQDIAELHSDMSSAVLSMEPSQEYLSFSLHHRSPAEPPAYAEFLWAPLEDEEPLTPGELQINDLTLQSCQQGLEALEAELLALAATLGSQQAGVEELQQEVESKGQRDDLFGKKLALEECRQQVALSLGRRARLEAQRLLLKEKLGAVGADGPPDSTKGPDQGSEVRISKGPPGILRTEDEGCPLDLQPWFHGGISRQEVHQLLQSDGDFLVRRGRGQQELVLSVQWGGVCKHLLIRRSQALFRLDSESFVSVAQLIQHLLSSQQKLSRRTDAVLRRPVLRDRWTLQHDDIMLGALIGQGNFGEVYRGTLRSANTPVAVKTCKEDLDPDQRKKFLMEARILSDYEHPNIVRLIGVCALRRPVYIVMELVSGGDFLSLLRSEGRHLGVKTLVKMVEDVASGMHFLQSRKCIHRDLAARNCLVTEQRVVKISDFGMSRQQEDGVYAAGAGLRQVPIKWTAPEALSHGLYTSESDVWSFGVLLWEVFSFGATPYTHMSNQQAREQVERGYRMAPPPGCPPQICLLMSSCWRQQAASRPNFHALGAELGQLHRSLT